MTKYIANISSAVTWKKGLKYFILIICKYILNVNNNKMRHIALKLRDVKTDWASGLRQVMREEEITKPLRKVQYFYYYYY